MKTKVIVFDFDGTISKVDKGFNCWNAVWKKLNALEVDEKYFSDEIRKLESLKNKIAGVLKQALGVSVRVKLCEPKTIQRSEGKAKRVIDNRKL